MGEGGGLACSSIGEFISDSLGEAGLDVAGPTESARPVLEAAERVLLPDLTDAASDLSFSVPDIMDIEFRGLSVLVPGIFDLNDRKDLDDSLVSDLLNDG